MDPQQPDAGPTRAVREVNAGAGAASGAAEGGASTAETMTSRLEGDATKNGKFTILDCPANGRKKRSTVPPRGDFDRHEQPVRYVLRDAVLPYAGRRAWRGRCVSC